MSNITLEFNRLQGEIVPPADKSISHRAIIISALTQGKTQIENLSLCDDCLRSIDACKNMGIAIKKMGGVHCVEGKGLHGLIKPKHELYMGNSATSMRLILGVLAAQPFKCVLTGDASLSQRPMKRVIEPLALMGAKITGREGTEFAPLAIEGKNLQSIRYKTPVASAQVKSAILLAGLYAQGQTQVQEPGPSRDHTERMLAKFGADISVKDLTVSIVGPANLISTDLAIPADISAASFFLVGACLAKNSQVIAKKVGLNPTRTAFLNILEKMGASLSWKYENNQMPGKDYADEPRGEISARFSYLRAVNITPEQIPALIDELPILMVAATQAEGETVIQGAGELRVKETDRIKAMVVDLSRLGAQIISDQDNIIIRGPAKLVGNTVDSFHDHRTAMSMAIASLAAQGRTTIKNADCVNISFPGFFRKLAELT